MPKATACYACELTFPLKDLAKKPGTGPRPQHKVYCWKCHPDQTKCDKCGKDAPTTACWVSAMPPHAVWCAKCITKSPTLL